MWGCGLPVAAHCVRLWFACSGSLCEVVLCLQWLIVWGCGLPVAAHCVGLWFGCSGSLVERCCLIQLEGGVLAHCWGWVGSLTWQ